MTFSNQNPFRLGTSSAIFPVTKAPLNSQGSISGAKIQCDSHEMVIRKDANGENPRCIGVVGSDYKLLKNEALFENVENTILGNVEAPLMRDAFVNTSSSYDGAWTQREYVMPAFSEALETSDGFKTSIGFRAIAWNSYDGSSSAGMVCGLIDFYCKNGMLIGALTDMVKRRHTKHLYADHFNDMLVDGLGTVQEEVHALRRMAVTTLNADDAVKVLESHFSASRAKKLMERVEDEAAVRGWNVFALHSALTYYSSHNSDQFGVRMSEANDNTAAVLHQRGQEVAKVMRSQDFLRLTA